MSASDLQPRGGNTLFRRFPTNVFARCLHGTTYPFKEILKEKGFTFLNELNGFDGVSMWIAPQATVDIEDLVALFHEYGFEVDMFDGVDED